MKTSVKVALGIALVWIILTLIIYLTGYSKELFATGILLNIFFLLSAISFGLFLTKKEKGFAESIFIEDFKIAMQGGLVYTILISGFLYLYHSKIDTTIRGGLIDGQTELLHASYPNSESFKVLQEESPEWKDKNYDLFIEEQEDNIRGLFSAFSVFIFHLMALFIFSMFFSFFGTIIIRRVILR